MIGRTERDLVSQVATYMQVHYPRVIYRFDLAADMKLTAGQASRHKSLHPRRGYPDLFIAARRSFPDDRVACGLFLELKREGTRLTTKSGKWANDHIAEQAEMLDDLAQQDYIAQFAVGFGAAKELIDSYLAYDSAVLHPDEVPF